MEGKAVLFKKFANIDAFDLEIDEVDPLKFVDTVAKLEPTFGAINLEDIKAPDCFIIEAALSEKIRNAVNNDTNLKGSANLLVMPNLDAANIAVELIRSINGVLMIGPILSGTAMSATHCHAIIDRKRHFQHECDCSSRRMAAEKRRRVVRSN